MQYFNYITGKWQDQPMGGSAGGYQSGTGSSSNPIDLDGATVKPKGSTGSSGGDGFFSGFKFGDLLVNMPGLISSVGNLFGETRTNPIIPGAGASTGTGAPPPEKEKDNTITYVLIGAGVLVLFFVMSKKK